MGRSELPSNTWFLGPTRILNSNSISVGSAVFAQLMLMAQCPYALQWAALSPQNCPFLWRDLDPIRSLGPSEPTTQTTSHLVQPFLHILPQNVPILYKIASSHGGIWTPSVLWPTQFVICPIRLHSVDIWTCLRTANYVG